MAQGEILIVEDDEDILELLRFNLSREGFRVSTADCGCQALNRVGGGTPDLVILDLSLPDMDGLEICSRLRSAGKSRDVPVLILTARDSDEAVVNGLESGADDYLAKPFSVAELIARVRALLRGRQAPAEEKAVLVLNGLLLNSATHDVSYDGAQVELTNREFKLLHLLARRPGWTYSRKQIVGLMSETGAGTTERSIDVLVAGLRKKLRGGGQIIETVRGTGYKLKG
jgi:two-component system phosphate regulon response regulator PhoB